VVYVLGGPGSGKGTQCHKIVSDYGFVHLSTGDLLREEVKNNGPNAEEIAKRQKEGELVSSDLLCTLIKSTFEKHPKTAKFLLDGFPRSQDNLDAWDKVIGNKVEVPFLLFLKCSEETMVKRILERGQNRTDDNPETIKKRIEVFYSQTIPMVEKLKNKVVEINSEESPDEVYKNVKAILEGKGLNK
jgi:UMP-CMP kinase family protein